MTRRERVASSWPLLMAAAALLALCLYGPNAWDEAARETPLSGLLARGVPQGEPTLAPPKKKRQVVVGQAAEVASMTAAPAIAPVEQNFAVEPLRTYHLPPLILPSDAPLPDFAETAVMALPAATAAQVAFNEPLERLPPTSFVPRLDDRAVSAPLANRTPYTPSLSPFLAYPRTRTGPLLVLAPEHFPATPATSTFISGMIGNSTTRATNLAGQIPSFTAPVRDLIGHFTSVVVRDPLSFIADEIHPHEHQPGAAPLIAGPTNTAVVAPLQPSIAAPVTGPGDRTALRPDRTGPSIPALSPPPAGLPGQLFPALSLPNPHAQPEVARPQAAPVAMRVWPESPELVAHLQRARWSAEGGAWAMDTLALIDELGLQDSPRSLRSTQILGELKQQVHYLNEMVTALGERPASDDLRRAGFSLSRRLDLWSSVAELWQPQEKLVQLDNRHVRLQHCLQELAVVSSKSSKSHEWRDYLLLDALNELATQRETVKSDQQIALVRRVLSRLDAAGLKSWEQQFASATPLVQLRDELRNWGSEQLDIARLLSEIEAFEQQAKSSQAHDIAVGYRKLARSTKPAEQQFARHLETHYRNANLRLTFTDEMVNRFLPPQQSRNAPVNDTMMGLQTRGWSRTNTDVQVRFIPDPTRIRMALEARGTIFSQTYTASGPVTVYNDADSSFFAAKELRMDLEGFDAGHTAVESSTFPRLKKVQSKLDTLPFIRSIVQGVAKSEYEEKQPQARAEAKRKISNEVRTHMDEEISGAIRNGNEFFTQRVIQPLIDLGLSPQLVESQTTRNRATMRLRLAGSEQLAGHGPRPRAPSNSLASMQLHESVINNACQQLGWEGKTLTLIDMRQQLAKTFKMHAPAAKTAEDEELNDNLKDLYFSFAPQNAVQVYCRDGRLEVNLSFTRLRKGAQSWKDFTVRVFYRPDLNQSGAPLCRDGTVQLIGDRLNTGAQIALRGIFSKAFSASRQMKLIPDKLVAAKPGLADVFVTQCELRDGWLGIALATNHPLPPVEPLPPEPQPRVGLFPRLRR